MPLYLNNYFNENLLNNIIIIQYYLENIYPRQTVGSTLCHILSYEEIIFNKSKSIRLCDNKVCNQLYNRRNYVDFL